MAPTPRFRHHRVPGEAPAPMTWSAHTGSAAPLSRLGLDGAMQRDADGLGEQIDAVTGAERRSSARRGELDLDHPSFSWTALSWALCTEGPDDGHFVLTMRPSTSPATPPNAHHAIPWRGPYHLTPQL